MSNDRGATPRRGLTMSTDDNAADQDRIDQLERVVREQQRELEALAETLGIENPKEEAKTYSRRAALGLGAAGVAGAAGYGVGSAQADPNNTQEGTIGDGDEDLDVQDMTANHVASNSINTESVNDVLYASENKASLPSISDALDTAEANAPATVAVVDPGTHIVSISEQSAALYWETDNVTLRIGDGVTIKMADGEHTNSDGHVVRVGDGATPVDGAAITGSGTIDGNKANNDGSNLLGASSVYFHGPLTDANVENVTVANSPGDAVLARGESSSSKADDVTIKNVTVDDCAEGILAQDVTDWLVEDCHVEGTSEQDGIEPAAGVVEWVIRGCTVEDTGQQGIDVYAGASDGTIENCTVRRWGTAYGIHLSDYSTASSNITIRDCTVEEEGTSADGGIQVAAGQHVNITIRDNTIRDVGIPIWVAGSAGPYEVVDNTIKDCTSSVELRAASDRMFEGNTVINVNSGGSASVFDRSTGRLTARNNTIMFPSTATDPDYGIWVVDADAGYTEGNVIYATDFANGAINDQSAAGHTVTGNYT